MRTPFVRPNGGSFLGKISARRVPRRDCPRRSGGREFRWSRVVAVDLDLIWDDVFFFSVRLVAVVRAVCFFFARTGVFV